MQTLCGLTNLRTRSIRDAIERHLVLIYPDVFLHRPKLGRRDRDREFNYDRPMSRQDLRCDYGRQVRID
jgi:hypothetical protein